MTGIGRFAGGAALILLVAHPLANAQLQTVAAGRAGPGVLRLRAGVAQLSKRPNLLDSAEPFASGMRHVIQLDGPMSPRRRAELAGIGVRPRNVDTDCLIKQYTSIFGFSLTSRHLSTILK